LPVTATAIESENCDFPTVESDTNQQAVVADASAELVSSLAFPVDCKPPLSYEQQVSNKQDSFDDEYDDFEEFKSAEQVASCKTEVLMDSKDSSAGQWAAFGSSEPVDDGDDWAAFQETNATNTDSMPSATHPAEIQDSPALSFSGSSQVCAISQVIWLKYAVNFSMLIETLWFLCDELKARLADSIIELLVQKFAEKTFCQRCLS
jgi:hypothetical protein